MGTPLEREPLMHKNYCNWLMKTKMNRIVHRISTGNCPNNGRHSRNAPPWKLSVLRTEKQSEPPKGPRDLHSAKVAGFCIVDTSLEGEDTGDLQLARAANWIDYDTDPLAGKGTLRRPRSDLSERRAEVGRAGKVAPWGIEARSVGNV
jgi:hypothetical protein